MHAEGDVIDVHATGRLGDCLIKASAGDLTVEHVGAATLMTAGRVTAGQIDGAATIASTSRVYVRRIVGSATIDNKNGTTHWLACPSARRLQRWRRYPCPSTKPARD